jgi:hypothetical protein
VWGLLELDELVVVVVLGTAVELELLLLEDEGV